MWLADKGPPSSALKPQLSRKVVQGSAISTQCQAPLTGSLHSKAPNGARDDSTLEDQHLHLMPPLPPSNPASSLYSLLALLSNEHCPPIASQGVSWKHRLQSLAPHFTAEKRDAEG